MLEDDIEFESAAGRVEQFGEFFLGVGGLAGYLEMIVGEEVEKGSRGNLF